MQEEGERQSVRPERRKLRMAAANCQVGNEKEETTTNASMCSIASNQLNSLRLKTNVSP